MDYKKIYRSLIERAQNRCLTSYCESHHIVPRCMGGNNDKLNLVDLTAREHFIAHLLLSKIYPNHMGLVKAAMMMCVANDSQKLRVNNRRYGWLKEKHSLAMSQSQSGNGNSQFNTRWIHNDKLQISKKIQKNEILPVDWSEGRKIKFNIIQRECVNCKSLFTPNSLSIFCNEQCKKYYKNPIAKFIDSHTNELINRFNETKSINKTLIDFGITGRKGNAYLSSILKEHGYKILRRRNSK